MERRRARGRGTFLDLYVTISRETPERAVDKYEVAADFTGEFGVSWKNMNFIYLMGGVITVHKKGGGNQRLKRTRFSGRGRVYDCSQHSYGGSYRHLFKGISCLQPAVLMATDFLSIWELLFVKVVFKFNEIMSVLTLLCN